MIIFADIKQNSKDRVMGKHSTYELSLSAIWELRTTVPELQKYMPGYEKTKRYFIRTNLYKYLIENGDL